MSGTTQGHHGMAYGQGPNGQAGSNQGARGIFGKDLIYKFNTPDAGNMYLLVTEAIAIYVSENYGVAMMNLVKYGKETVFTEPVSRVSTTRATRSKDDAPATTTDADETYRVRLGFYLKQEAAYKEDKGKVFGLIMSCCIGATKTRLESNDAFAELEQNSDVVGLLKLLRTLAFSIDESGDPYAVLLGMLKRMIGINQGPNETVVNYHRRFMAQVDVLEAQWGMFYPPAMIAADTTNTLTNKIARD